MLPAAAGVKVSGVAVSVRAWAVWTMSVRASKAGHSAPLMRKLGDKDGASG